MYSRIQLLRTALSAAVIVCCAAGVQTRSATTATPTTTTTAPTTAIPSEKQKPIFDLMNVEAAWETTRGSPDCLVGIIDTGFDFFHPALRGAVQPGYVADNVFHSPAFPVIAHGTGMASLIVAQRVDEEGMIGLAPGCRVIAAQQGMPEHTLARMQQRFMREHPTPRWRTSSRR